jgi:ribulose kinase
MILLDVGQIPTFENSKFYKTGEDILNLLGMLFSVNSKNAKIVYCKHSFQEIDLHYEGIINLLAHVTFKLTKSFKLKDLAPCLKSTFSCYNNSDESSIESNITKKHASTIKSLSTIKSESSENVKRILRKIDGYELYLKRS